MPINPLHLLTKISPVKIERKSYNPITSFAANLYQSGLFDLGSTAAISLYEQASPFFNAVDMRATAFSSIPMRLFDIKTEQYVDDHPALDLLRQPNGDVTQNEFLYQVATYFDILGNVFLWAGGRIDNPPLELATIMPQSITFDSTANAFGLLNIPSAIHINQMMQEQSSYFPIEDPATNLIRFVDPDQTREIWHIRQFSPRRTNNQFWGMSRSQPLWLEIQQYIDGNTSNLSMLKRGSRISMAWINKRGEELTDNQWQRLQEEAQKYSGAHNAGGTPVLDGVEVAALSQTNRDMEFRELQRDMIMRISNVYGIPLPLLLDAAMTFNNLEASMLQFFDRAVIPLANYIYAELTRFLLPRYDNSENLVFRFNENDIEPLRIRIVENAKRQGEIGVNTPNEIREILGDEPIEGGDELQSGTSAGFEQPDAESANNDADQQPEARFVQLLTQLKNKDGTRRYSDDDIDVMTAERFSTKGKRCR